MNKSIIADDIPLTMREFALNSGQIISILFRNGEAVCFRPEKTNLWEPIGEANRNLAIAINRLGTINHTSPTPH